MVAAEESYSRLCISYAKNVLPIHASYYAHFTYNFIVTDY